MNWEGNQGIRTHNLTIRTAFEGLAHPYQDNIVKFGGQSVLGASREVAEAFKEAKEAQSSA
jgi:large subunit ribosomal protein L13